jgi:uncharacterized protein
VGFEPTTPALRERCSGLLSYVGVCGDECSPLLASLFVRVVVADSAWARLRGLAFRRRPPDGWALLIPRCRSVHTFGMRFAIDLVWLDDEGVVREVHRAVPPRRVASCRGAKAVIETKAGDADQAADWATSRRSGIIPAMAQTQQPSPPNRWLEAFNPRVPLYRDTYNEYLVFVVSAIGSVAGTQVPLYLVMALTDLWNVWVFVAACVVFELFVIFFIARPQMKPNERVMWAALWAGATAMLALAFYYLVAEPTL